MDVMVHDFEIVESGMVDFVLSCNPLQALRDVWVNSASGVETVLTEGVDFTVDYVNRSLVLNNELSVGDVLYVKYTPYLVDGGLALAYRVERSSLDVDVSILPYYFEYRV